MVGHRARRGVVHDVTATSWATATCESRPAARCAASRAAAPRFGLRRAAAGRCGPPRGLPRRAFVEWQTKHLGRTFRSPTSRFAARRAGGATRVERAAGLRAARSPAAPRRPRALAGASGATPRRDGQRGKNFFASARILSRECIGSRPSDRLLRAASPSHASARRASADGPSDHATANREPDSRRLALRVAVAQCGAVVVATAGRANSADNRTKPRRSVRCGTTGEFIARSRRRSAGQRPTAAPARGIARATVTPDRGPNRRRGDSTGPRSSGPVSP